MTIMASAKVPARNRLIDAPTLGITRPPACPAWCRRDHTGEVTEYDGFTVGSLHEQVVTELAAKDPCWVNRLATAAVLVESSSERGVTVEPARVVLNIAEGPIEGIDTPLVTQGWTGTPEQAEALAAALLAAARTVRSTR